MSGADEVRLSLKLMINKEKTKVLFASVDNAFADVLLSFLTIPLGGILQLLKYHYGEKAPRIGCLNSLQDSLQNLDSACFWTEQGKHMLLNPRSSLEDKCRKLKINVYGSRPTKYFTCCDDYCRNFLSLDYDSSICPAYHCGKLMSKEIGLSEATENHGEVFTKQVPFLIGDDLRMVPNMTGTIMQNFKALGISDIDGAEFRTVSVGLNEVMDLLKESLLSNTPLSNVFLHERCTTQKSQPIPSLPKLKDEETFCSKEMTVRATIQKSKNAFLFAQAGEGFVDFLFSLLTIPLAEVESLFRMYSSLGCIDNLYWSVANFDAECLKSKVAKDMLLKPYLPPCYESIHRIFSLSPFPVEYIRPENNGDYLPLLCKSHGSSYRRLARFVDPKGKVGSYVKGKAMFVVTDDLTVKPLCMVSSCSFIMEHNIPLSDIQEIDITIGPEEALSILRASLTSPSSALTIGLMLKLKLQKQPKLEH